MAAKEYQDSFVLTVAESKRLIAKGVARCPAVLAALKDGIVAVGKGTTNGYVVEELTGEPIHKPHYCTGNTRPYKGGSKTDVANKLPDLVLRCGQRWEGVTAIEAAREMKAGDVFIKGANALNYDLRQAGILVGDPTGGTIGAVIGPVIGRRATLLVPVGLEKNIPGDLQEAYCLLTAASRNGSGVTLWPVDGEIFTELEALDVLCGVDALPIGAGGICGAEGSVRIAVWGTKQQLQQVNSLLEGIYGEPAFAESP